MPKNKFFVSYISNFLLHSYCNKELKQTKTKNNCSTYGNKKNTKKKKKKERKKDKLLLMSNMVPIRILPTKYNRCIIQIRDFAFFWKPLPMGMKDLLSV